MGHKMRVLYRRTNTGVTLIEMAIVVAVIGLIATIIVPLLLRSIKQEKLSEGRRLVRSVRDEIVGYAIIHKRLPASLADVGHSKDAWLGDILYRPATSLVTADICGQNSTTLDLLQGAKTVDDVAFVVVSRGENYNMQIDNATNAVRTYDQGTQVDSYILGSDPNRPTDQFDDILEFVTLGYLQSKMCTATAQTSPVSPAREISFAANMAEFHSPAMSSGQPSITVDQATKTVTLGNDRNNIWGCLWYQGDSANCTAGACPSENGLRAYFRYSLLADTSGDSRTRGHGFTFAMVSSNNPSDACGDRGEYLGYAGSGSPNIQLPKMAVEFDVHPDPLLGGTARNHVALVYWGTPLDNNDDNTHGVGSAPINPLNSSPGYINATSVTWLEDATVHHARVEMDRNATTRQYILRAWPDCSNCDDLTSAFSGTGGITDTITLNASQHAGLENLRFGWTIGTTNRSQTVTISDFVVRFLP